MQKSAVVTPLRGGQRKRLNEIFNGYFYRPAHGLSEADYSQPRSAALVCGIRKVVEPLWRAWLVRIQSERRAGAEAGPYGFFIRRVPYSNRLRRGGALSPPASFVLRKPPLRRGGAPVRTLGRRGFPPTRRELRRGQTPQSAFGCQLPYVGEPRTQAPLSVRLRRRITHRSLPPGEGGAGEAGDG